MTISCKLMGGLGNQLFQIFATIAYGLDTNHRVVFPYTDFVIYGRRTYWRNFLNHLAIMTTANPDNGLQICDLDTFSVTNEQEELHYHPLPKPSLSTTDVSLYGYFQSPKYFEHHKDTIFEMIHLEDQRTEIRNAYHYFDNLAGPIISMHFRLGDYKNSQYHNVLDAEYYRSALERMWLLRNAPNHMRILYFCEQEDNADVQQKINHFTMNFPNYEFVKVDDRIEDWRQMLLMSLCDSHIIANSTFSWWGAYMNPSVTKNVIYPKQWFGPALARINMETSDLFPVDWYREPTVPL